MEHVALSQDSDGSFYVIGYYRGHVERAIDIGRIRAASLGHKITTTITLNKSLYQNIEFWLMSLDLDGLYLATAARSIYLAVNDLIAQARLEIV